MEAITALCPLLKEINLQRYHYQPSTSDLLSPAQLSSLLSLPDSCWEMYGIFKNINSFYCCLYITYTTRMVNSSFQVYNIGMWCVPIDYCRVVLDCLGSDQQLRKLRLSGLRDVDPLLELLSAPQTTPSPRHVELHFDFNS